MEKINQDLLNDVSEKALSRTDMARIFSFYTSSDPSKRGIDQNNFASTEHPLIVNCAGNYACDYLFTTDKKNGRLDYQLIYVNSGRLTMFAGGREIIAKAGSVVLLPAGKPYNYTNIGSEKISYFWVHFTGSEVEARLKEYSIKPFPIVYETRLGNHIQQRFHTIFDAFSRRAPHFERELSALLERLLITVARSVIRVGEKQGVLFRSIKYIGANYSGNIRIATLAQMENLSVSRYNFLFKEQFGIPPTKYILGLRMSSAKELISSTDLSIKQIGIMCGYDDAPFFCKTFKGFFGVSPIEYRNAYAKKPRKINKSFN
ncbi:MAG: AraC family transcriptional regulator [Clostridia bacterium]|nr:AraC family transcriptional regulator [Clostridia bacterium]